MGQGNVLGHIGIAYLYQEKLAEAQEVLHASLAIFQAVGARPMEAENLIHLGNVHKKLQDFPQAIEIFNKSMGIFRALNSDHDEGRVLYALGTVYVAQEKHEDARQIWREAMQKVNPDSMDYKILIDALAEECKP